MKIFKKILALLLITIIMTVTLINSVQNIVYASGNVTTIKPVNVGVFLPNFNDAGIKTEELSLKYCNWDQECARVSTESLLLGYGNKIEAIIANNDSMAIGAIEALQKQGYFKGDKSSYIPVIGVDAIPAARELIKEGFMAGTVLQDPHAGAEAIYTVGMNMFSGKYPLDNTNYKFDYTGVVIRLPYYEYTK